MRKIASSPSGQAPRRRRLGAAVTGALLAGALTATGCSSSAPAASGGSGGGWGQLTLGTSLTLVSFDPYNGIDQNYAIDHTLYSYLITYDKNRDPQPDLATSWTFAPDDMSVSIKLRTAEFSDGTPVTAADIVAGVKRAENPATGLTQAGVARFIASVTPQGQHAVIVRFNHPTARDTVLDWMFFFPVVEASKNNPAYLQNHAAGSGPFVLQSYSPNNSLVLSKNPHYYNPAEPKLKTVEIKFFNDQSSMIAALQFGQLNAAQFVDYNLLGQLKGQFNIIQGSPDAETMMFYLNPTLAPFNVRGCRQAITRAVDRQQIMQVVQGGEGFPVPGPFTPGSVGYNKSLLTADGFDLQAAKAGIAANCTTKTATAVVPPNPPGVEQALEIIQKDLASAGFTLNLQPQDAATFITALHAGKTQATMYPTVNPFRSIASLATNRAFSPLSSNYWWGKTGAPAQYVQASDAAEVAVTPGQISQAAATLNTALVDQAWVTGVYTEANHFVLSKQVSGFLTNPADQIELAETTVGS